MPLVVLWVALATAWLIFSPLDVDSTFGALIAWTLWYVFLAAVAWLLHAVLRGIFRAVRGLFSGG